MSSELGQQFLDHLKKNKASILQTWASKIIITENKMSGELIQLNGSTMFDLTIELFAGKLVEEQIELLAQKVASERAKANINIGDFIYNVYIGRTILLEQFYQINLSSQDLLLISNQLNGLFDRFVTYAVRLYSEIKDTEIKEKLLFIKDTHKDRLTLLGQMSSSFVHEFRNPLTAIMGFVKLLRAGEPNDLYFDTIEHELEELKFRITRFLHTSKLKIEDEHIKEISISKLIEDLLQFLYPSLVSDDINVETQMNYTGTINAKEEEVKQVILNLLMNAVEAVKSNQTTSFIRVSCRLEDAYVKVEVGNNGPKIPEHTQKTIFEPFYTTKELGTGIGLYVCKQIIENHHGGKIECQSNDEETIFTIFLPLSC